MNLQSLERTYIDKVFALCDYYLQGKSKRYSRHSINTSKKLSRVGGWMRYGGLSAQPDAAAGNVPCCIRESVIE